MTTGASMTLARSVQLISGKRPLPGDEARAIMLPEYRRNAALHPKSGGATWREAAVLILFYDDRDQARFPLILRVDGPGVHAGQVSLPGGAREPGESPQACAVREASEETGVEAGSIQIIRELSPLQVPPSRFTVQPFVGMINQHPSFKPAPDEVAAIMAPSIDELLDPGNRTEEMLTIRGKEWRVPCYRLAGHRVWGATAMILAELAALLASHACPSRQQ
ncbi:MAG: CoA pyrophosphatase [Spirochaetota bacterium]